MLQPEFARLAEALTAIAQENPKAREAFAALGSLLSQIAAGGRSGGRVARPGAFEARVPAERAAEGDWGEEQEASERRTPASLELIAKRSRIKAEACRWAVERRRMLESGGAFEDRIAPRDAELIERARSLENCFLWPLHPYADLPDDHQLEVIAGSYECLAVSAESMMEIDARTGNRDIQQEAMQLLAASQSALRKALFEGGRRQRDPDQEDAFHWLKDQTGKRRIYVARHMRLMDPADPEAWEERIETLQQLVEQIESEGDDSGSGEIKSHLNRIRYHASRVDAETADRSDWERMDDAVRVLLEQYDMSPSDPALMEALELAVDMMPDDFEPGTPLRIALQATGEWLDSFEDEEDEDDDDYDDDDDDDDEDDEEDEEEYDDDESMGVDQEERVG